MKCVICGGYIPDGAMATMKRPNSKPDYVTPREVCFDCTSEDKTKAPAQKMEIPNECIDGAVRLAGTITRGCLKLYSKLYVEAVKAMFEGVTIENPIDVMKDKTALGEFLRYHREVHKRQALNLTLGKMPELAAYIRRKESEGWDAGMKKAAEKLEDMLEVKV